MRLARLSLLPLALLLLAAVPMEWPRPITWPEYVDSTRVAKGLLEALANRKWLIEGDTGESITARYVVRGHWLRIRIDYTPRGLAYRYLDSQDFDYEETNGGRFIHRRANKIMGQLNREVRIQVQRLRFEREPAQVVPVDPVEPPAAGDEPPEQSP
jgi:hypothetical protein